MVNRERGRHQRRQSGGSGLNKTVLAVIILGVAVLLLGAFGFVDYRLAADNSKNDQKTFCRKDSLPDTTVILIDHTDRIDAVQRAALENRLWDIADSVEKNGAIKVFSVDRVNDSALSPDIDLCNPGREESVSEWTGNKRLAHKHYEEQFKKPIGKLLDKVFTAETASQSPIMEALQSVVVTSFIGGRNKSDHKKLVLVSDLLEHTDQFSLYKGIPSFDVYKKTPHWPSVRSDLSGVEIKIFFLHRSGEEKLQTPELRKFWVEFLEEQGAIVTNFVPIEG